MQYTLRNIPKAVDKALRAKARADGKSLNQAALDVMKSGLGVSDEPGRKRNLSDLAGSMSREDARAIEKAVARMDKADLESRR
jgi:plasmid stability protein